MNKPNEITCQAEAFELGFAAGKQQAEHERDEARAQVADLLTVLRGLLAQVDSPKHGKGYPEVRAAIAAAEGRQS
jgi:hypothetical protein